MSKLSSGSTAATTTTTIIVLVIALAAVVLSGCTDTNLPADNPAIDADTDGGTAMQNTEADLDAALQLGKPVVVYFNEAMCSKCKDQKPIIRSIEETVGNQATVIVLDRKESPKVVSEYNITIAPNMLIFDGDGKVISTGYVGSEELASVISAGATETNNEIDGN